VFATAKINGVARQQTGIVVVTAVELFWPKTDVTIL